MVSSVADPCSQLSKTIELSSSPESDKQLTPAVYPVIFYWITSLDAYTRQLKLTFSVNLKLLFVVHSC